MKNRTIRARQEEKKKIHREKHEDKKIGRSRKRKRT